MFQPIRSLTSLKRAALAGAVAAIVGVGLSATPAQAEFEQGDFELRLAGFAINDVNFDGVRANVQFALGYFFTDQAELGVRQLFTYSDIGPTDLSGSTAIFINYHFGQDNAALQPFIGANIGYQYGDLTHDTFFGGPEVGLKYFVSENWFIFGEVQYQFLFDEPGDADEGVDDGNFVYGLGIGAVIGEGR